MPVPFPSGPTYKKRNPKYYTIKTGDTLSGIATQMGVDTTVLAQANEGVPVIPGNAFKLPTQNTIGIKTSNENVVGVGSNALSKVMTGVSQKDLTRSSTGINYNYGGATSAPTATNMPDVYNAQLHTSGIEYQDNRMTFFEKNGLLAPSVDATYAKVRGINTVNLVNAGYVLSGSTWVLPSTGTGGGTVATGGQQQYTAQGDYWQYKQDIALQNAQAYGSPNAQRRNMTDMLEYKGAKKNNPDLTYREWLMRKMGKWKQANIQYPDEEETEEETGNAAVQPQYSYSNSYYSSTGRSKPVSGGLITWRT